MEKTWKIVRVGIGIAAAAFLVGSFPVKHYYGQPYCDVLRVIGFILLFSYFGILAFAKKK